MAEIGIHLNFVVTACCCSTVVVASVVVAVVVVVVVVLLLLLLLLYTGNIHKWAYAPRGCAVLWIDPSFHNQIFPVVTSRKHDTSILSKFSYSGTSDMSNYYSVGCAVDFYRNTLGGYVSRISSLSFFYLLFYLVFYRLFCLKFIVCFT